MSFEGGLHRTAGLHALLQGRVLVKGKTVYPGLAVGLPLFLGPLLLLCALKYHQRGSAEEVRRARSGNEGSERWHRATVMGPGRMK